MSDLLKVRVGGSRYLCKWDPHSNEVKIGDRWYPYVQIGSQLWLAENLDYKFEVNGRQISINPGGSPSAPAAWYYNNEETTYGIDGTYKCGLLYNWYAASYLNNNKSTLLPEGWHIPTRYDYVELSNTIGSNVGTKLKAENNTITSDFPSDWNGTDDYGFNALPSGKKRINFEDLGSKVYFWTSTEYGTTINAYRIKLDSTSSMSTTDYESKTNALSLRLVKDVT